jgi:hypothetical protein
MVMANGESWARVGQARAASPEEKPGEKPERQLSAPKKEIAVSAERPCYF